MSQTAIKYKLIETQTTGKAMDGLTSVITAEDLRDIMDSHLKRCGVAAFTHEFGEDKLRRAYTRYTYLFIELMAQCGNLYRVNKNRIEDDIPVRYSLAGSMLSTFVLLELKDQALDGPITEAKALRITDGICREFTHLDDVVQAVRSVIRHNVRNYSKYGIWHCGLPRLTVEYEHGCHSKRLKVIR